MTRPCPFCGSTDIQIGAVSDDKPSDFFAYADDLPDPAPPAGGWVEVLRNRCGNCDAIGPIGLVVDEATNTVVLGATWDDRAHAGAQEAQTR